MTLEHARLIVAFVMARDLALEFSRLPPNHILLRDLDTAASCLSLTMGDIREADEVVKAAGEPGLFREATA